MNMKQINELIDSDVLVECECNNCGMIKILRADDYNPSFDSTSKCCDKPCYCSI